jgi:chromosome segregation ATPase
VSDPIFQLGKAVGRAQKIFEGNERIATLEAQLEQARGERDNAERTARDRWMSANTGALDAAERKAEAYREALEAAERELARVREALEAVADWSKNNPEQEHAPLSDSGVEAFARAALTEQDEA